MQLNKRIDQNARAPRDAGVTRERLLQAAFREIYESGFESADVTTVVNRAGVTKGALYHHFDGKKALCNAVISEVIGGITRDKWVRPLSEGANPIDTLIRIVQGTSLRPDDIRGGCPLNNLAQEMSGRDEIFRQSIAAVFQQWQDAIAAALRDGQARGLVQKQIDPNEAAVYLVAVYEGYISVAKAAHDRKNLQSGIRRILAFLESLRPHE
jgi:TetR/AcrR family transcriptional regulator, transcriptional repressor for nem operon